MSDMVRLKLDVAAWYEVGGLMLSRHSRLLSESRSCSCCVRAVDGLVGLTEERDDARLRERPRAIELSESS